MVTMSFPWITNCILIHTGYQHDVLTHNLNATRNLLSFRDIRANRLHVQMGDANAQEVTHLFENTPMWKIII